MLKTSQQISKHSRKPAMQVHTTVSLMLALSLLGSPSLYAETIKTIDGSINESVESVLKNDEGVAILKTDKRSIPLSNVRAIEFNPRTKAVPQESPIIVLTNGDRIRGQITGGNDEVIELRTVSLGRLKIELEKIRAVVLKHDMDFRNVEKILRQKTDKDLVYMRSTGKPVGGVLEKIGKKELVVEIDGAGQLKIKFAKIKMLLMSLIESPPKLGKGSHVRLKLLDGSSIHGVFSSAQNSSIVISALLNKKLSIRCSDVLEMLVLNGSFLYLSDLKPTKIVQKFPEGFQYYPDIFGWKRDRSVLGGNLKLGGKNYGKGLGVHSYCSLTFKLDGKYKEFRSVIGLDDSVRFLGEPGMGSVRFRVLVDGKAVKEYTEGVLMEKGASPKKINVNVQGAKSLTLVADYGPLLHILGRADWADAHLIRETKK
jgi:hypothetical protein